MPVHAALLLSLIESVCLAGVLVRWAAEVRGARLLASFLLGVAVWVAGQELPTWFGDGMRATGLALLATASLTSAAFAHFALAFRGVRVGRPALWALHGTALAATLLSLAVTPGDYVPYGGLRAVAVPNGFGWVTVGVWAGLAGIGQLVLLRGLLTSGGMTRRRIGAVMAASAWGLLCMSGYAVAALRLPFGPWPLLGLPLYPVILVYGILRYQVLVANAWARRALTWTLLVVAAGAATACAGALAPHLPYGDAGFASGAVAAAAVLVLGGPARRLAEGLVYPGRTVTADDVRSWRDALGATSTFDDLAGVATALLSRRLGVDVRVTAGGDDGRDGPVVACAEGDAGWSCALRGWEAAPPGPRRLGEVFADVLASQAARIAGLEASRVAERDRQTRERLAELGALATTVAHDLRNPLNNIGMAVAFASPEVRADVGEEVRRLSRLADDLLDYAKPWRVDVGRVDLAAEVRSRASRHPGVVVGAPPRGPAWVDGDRMRLHQAIDNLLGNAAATGARVGVDVEVGDGVVRVHVADDGPGVPEDVRDRLFQPFASRRAGGTGLGLPIVHKVVEAHGGTVGLTGREGWATCFTIELPGAR